MQEPEFSDEELMAYADGQMDPARAADLEAALADNRGLADRLALFVDTRAVARDAMSLELLDPVPDHLVQHVRALAAADDASGATTDDTVIAFPKNLGPKPQTPVWKLPLAASLALAVGIGAGLVLSPRSDGDLGSIQIAALTDADVVNALNSLPSGEQVALENGARVAPIATFFDGAETLCREFEFDRTDGMTIVSVACHKDGLWDVQMAVAAAAANTGYAPASSLETLDAYLTANEVSPPLDLEAEAAALSALR